MKILLDKDFYRPDEVADYLSVTKKTIYVWLSNGTIRGIKIGGVWRISKQEIIRIKELA